MANLEDQGVLARKVAQASAVTMQGGPGMDKSWRVVLARAARDTFALGLEVTQLNQSHASLAEVLDMPPDRAMIAVLEGPRDGLGLMAISAPLLAAMTEMQTIGRVSATAPVPRRPTRTDAAMVAGFIDTALAGLDVGLAESTDLVWAGGFRYASFLDDPRPLGLLLEDIGYRVLVADVTVELGVRAGQILMALPAAGRGQRPKAAAPAMSTVGMTRAFQVDLSEQVEDATCVLQAVVHRLTCPLATVIALQVGDVVTMPMASLDRIWLEGLDRQRLTDGRLGQNRGMRAVRLLPPQQTKAANLDAGHQIVDMQPVAAQH